MSYTPYFRKLSHANSSRKITDRTKDDNAEASEFTDQKFLNRKGGIHNIPSEYDDVQPAMVGKKPVKPEKGMKKFKGSKTIRKPEKPDTPEEDPEFGFYDPFGPEPEPFHTPKAYDPFGPEPEPFHTPKAYDPEFGFYDGFGPFGF